VSYDQYQLVPVVVCAPDVPKVLAHSSPTATSTGSSLGVRATGHQPSCLGDLLRTRRPGQVPSRRPGAARSRSGRRATRRRSKPDHPGLPSDRSVIASWEVDEMALTRPLPRAARAGQVPPIISETCPPGEGDLFCVKAVEWFSPDRLRRWCYGAKRCRLKRVKDFRRPRRAPLGHPSSRPGHANRLTSVRILPGEGK